MARAPVMAAGGIVVRAGARPLVAVVQRRKDSRWVRPKGKLKSGEKAAAAARHEVIEETGHDVTVHDFLGALSYDKGGRKSKVVPFWRMEAIGESGALMPDIKAVRWLPLKVAIAKLDDPIEQVFLRHGGRRAIMLSRARPTTAETRIIGVQGAAPQAQETVAPRLMVSNAPAIRPNLSQRTLRFFTRGLPIHERQMNDRLSCVVGICARGFAGKIRNCACARRVELDRPICGR